MSHAIIYSVPSTGTRFVADILTRIYGYARQEPETFGQPDPERQFLQLHVLDVEEDAPAGILSPVWNLGPRYPVVVPLRDPVMAYLTRHQAGDSRRRTERRWANLMAYCQWRDPLLFPVDLVLSTEERERLLTWLEKHLGITPPEPHNLAAAAARADLLRDWAPVGSRGLSQAQVDYLRRDPDEVHDDTRWLRPELQFYQREVRKVMADLAR